jgi:2-dehydro-3-deoxygluconokinase
MPSASFVLPNVPCKVDVSTFGEALGVFTAAETGRLRQVQTIEKGIGGAELNVAVALARLGHRPRWSGRLGDDEIGYEALTLLRSEGVDTVAADVEDGGRTGLYLKERGATGRVRVSYYRDASPATRVSATDLDLVTLTDARVVHVTGITAALQPYGADVVGALCAAAVERGRFLSLDINLRRDLLAGRDASAILGPALEAASLVVLSDEEAQILFGGGDPNTLLDARSGLPRRPILVVHGAWGAVAVDDDGVHRADAFRVVAQDTVGAGDAFMAGLLSGLLRGYDVQRALRLGNACGACAVSLRGDARSMPYEHDALVLLGGADASER